VSAAAAFVRYPDGHPIIYYLSIIYLVSAAAAWVKHPAAA
jgi:hypothetical protein